MSDPDLAAILTGDPAMTSAQFSIAIMDADAGAVLSAHEPDRVLRTASVGKLLLLTEVAARLAKGALDGDEPWERRPVDGVADSGIWQYLRTGSLPIADLAVLVAATSDNLATNVLLRNVGLAAVTARATSLGLQHTRLHDQVRSHRTADNPATLSTGTAAELAGFFAAMHRGEVVSSEVSNTLRGWLSLNCDLSMTAAAFGLNPLAHQQPDRNVLLHNKTGTDSEIRADTGLVVGPSRSIAYAVLANWSVGEPETLRDNVLQIMQRIGTLIRRQLGQG